jgi:predicted nucleic acid-binding protein
VVASVKSTRIYLDANVFIAAYETRGARSDHAWWILDAIEDGEFGAVTSELTLAEILVAPIQDGDDELVGQYQSIIASGDVLEVPAVDRRILIEAAFLRTMRRSLKLPDAVHVATARLRGCRYIVSDDRRLPFAPGIQVVQLGPHALDAMRTDKQ